MSDGAPGPIEEYVRTAARTLGLDLTPEQTARVTLVFARNAEIAAPVAAFDLPEDAPPAATFRP
jgi:hypothetical protein